MPQLYLKRSTVVEAEQWFPGRAVEAESQVFCSNHWWFILASGAALPLSPGDWLVRNPDGHSGYFPVPDLVFRATYEPASGTFADEPSWDTSLHD